MTEPEIDPMLGIPDPMVVLVYVLCIASTLLCVVYAWRNWNRDDEPDDVKWAKEEKKDEDEL